MSVVCCSNKCEKQFECAKHATNNEGTHQCEDWSSFGSGTYTDGKCEIDYHCGELGDYKMFEPVEKIIFPFQYLELFFLGKMDWDTAIDSTLEEFDRLIKEYVEKRK